MDANEFLLVYWHWLIFGVLLAAADVFFGRYSLLWFGLSAVVVGFVLLLFPAIPLVYQFVGWVLLARRPAAS